MEARLYLTQEERLRFKKLLERVTPSLLHDHELSLSFQVVRKRLSDFIEPLSPVSKTKELIQKLLFLMENRVNFKRKEDIAHLLKELSFTYGFQELSVSIEPHSAGRDKEVLGGRG